MLKNMKILYVDDDKATYELINIILKPLVKELKYAFDGLEGLELYKKYNPDIIISDIQMSNMDGLEMIRQIKSINPKQHTLIISSFDDSIYLKQAIELQVNGYILKPIKKALMLKELNQVADIIFEKKESIKNKTLYEEYYNTTNDIYISVDIKTNMIVNSNKSAREKFGYFKKEFNQLSINDIHAEQNGENIINQNVVSKILKNKSIHIDKFEFITKNKKRFYGSAKLYPVKDENGNIIQIHCVIKDRSLEITLKYHKKYLRMIFDTSNDFIFTTFGEKIDQANNSMFEFLGYKDLSDFQKNHNCICDFFKDEDGYIQKNMDGQNWVEYILLNPDIYHKAKIVKGDKEYIFGIVAKRFDFDKYERYIVFLTNITKLEIQYETIKEQEELLLLQSKQAAMGELIGMIAHQWKQPLSVLSLIASNELIKLDYNEQITKEQLRNDAQDIMSQVTYLSNTIDNFRDFLKPTKTTNLNYISEIIEDIKTIIGRSLKSHNIELQINIEEDLQINSYTKDLAQVLINICNNSKDAFIDNEIKNRKLMIDTKKKENEIIIIITDNAGGIDENIIKKIYTPYFTTKVENKGTGIGLYMVKNIVEKQLKGLVKTININNGVQTTISVPIDLTKN